MQIPRLEGYRPSILLRGAAVVSKLKKLTEVGREVGEVGSDELGLQLEVAASIFGKCDLMTFKHHTRSQIQMICCYDKKVKTCTERA